MTEAAATGATAGGTRRRRSRGSRARLALALVAGLLLSVEVVLRVGGFVQLDVGGATPEQAAFNAADMFVPSHDPLLGYENKPGASAVVAGVEYRHDERGRRVSGSASGDAAGATEVVFLGDSTTYGLGLPAGETLPAQVAAALGGRIVARNFGVCGYGTAQEAELFRRAVAGSAAAGHGGGLVVLVFYPNDFSGGTFLWDSRLHLMYVDPLPLPQGLKQVLWRSAAYRALVSGLTARMKARHEFDPNAENEAVAFAAVEELSRAVAADGRRLLVAHLPGMEELDPYKYAEPIEQLRQTCERIGVPYVDLLDGFLAERERQAAAYEAKSGKPVSAELRRGFLSQYWISDPMDHHLNAAANRIAAAGLARAIEPLLGH